VTHRPDPNPLTGRLLDRLLPGVAGGVESTGGPGGEAPAGDDLDARLAADPIARRERDALQRLLAAETRTADPALDAAASSRIAARVLDRVRHEEERAERAERTARARPALVRWAWGLGAAFALHVAFFAVLGFRALERREPRSTEPYVTNPFGAGESPDRSTAMTDDEAVLDVRPPDSIFPAYEFDEDLLAIERARLVDPEVDVVIPVPGAPTDFAPRAMRAMAVRSNDAMKRLIERKVGSTGSLDRVQQSLRALAARQSADGFWPATSDEARTSTTALVLLAFLGDGHSSRGGDHRDVVARGIARLRASEPLEGDAYALWALSEDYLLVNGGLTPAESRARSVEITALAARVATSTGGSEPAEAHRLALDAAARVGVLSRQPGGGDWSVTTSSRGDELDAPWVGSAILRAGRGEEFRTWASTASVQLRALLGEDGLVKTREGASESQRIAETALLLLALQTPYRTL
jgi:hypothetical protein